MSEVSDSVAELRHVNALIYARESSGSLIAERTQKLSYPASLTYNLGSTVQFVINSGAESVWGPSSYLRLKVTCTTTGAVNLDGSWLNLISQARLYHRSGELLEQVFFSDVLSNIKLRYQTSFSDYQKLASLIGAPSVVGAGANTAGLLPTAGDGAKTGYYMLPLSLIFGVFDNHQSYIPSLLLAGARCELVLNSTTASMALSNVTDATIALTPVLSLDCVKLYDEAAKQIMEESSDVASSGIQFTYSTYFASQFQPGVSTALNIDVLMSASLTERVFVVKAADSGLNKYKFISLADPAVKAGYAWQFRLGSSYKPIYSVESDQESFYQTQIAFDGAYNQFNDAPSHTGVGVTEFGANSCVYAMTLERSANNVSLSGEPVNNSRLCNFSCQNMFSTAATSTATVFLCYTRVANVMMDSCVVDR